MDLFSSREIAVFVWTCIFCLFAFSKNKSAIQKSLTQLYKVFFRSWRLPIFGFITIAYVAISTQILSAINLWDFSLLKDTVFWLCFSTSVVITYALSNNEHETIIKKVLADSFKIIIFLEYLTSTYTYSLPVELVLVLLIMVVTGMNIVAKHNKEYLVLYRITQGIILVFGAIIIYRAVQGAISDWQNLHSLATMQKITLSPILSFCFIPFLYFSSLYSIYEQLFINLNLGREKTKEVKRYAKRQIVKFGKLNRPKLLKFLNNHRLDLMRLSTKSDMDLLIKTVDIQTG